MIRRSTSCARIWLAVAAIAITGCRGGGVTSNGKPAPSAVLSTISFEDVTQQAGISWIRCNGAFGKKWMPETMGGGGGFIDYDNDGLPDIVLVNGDWWPGHGLKGARPTLALYHNEGGGRFRDVTAETGLNISLQGMGVAVGDYDNDGWDDLLITTVNGSRLFHNELAASGERLVAGSKPRSKRLFRDVTASSGVAGSGWCTSAAWLDYDNDGKLDLFVCHYVQWSPTTDQFCGGKTKVYCTPVFYAGDSCHLYHNEGGGRFKDVTREAGLWNDRAKALGVVAQDVDGDGKVDILVANDQETNFLYHNDGGGKFSDISLESGIGLNAEGHARAGMGIDVADIANDGQPAVLIGNFALEGVALHVRRTDGIFGDRSRESGMQQPSFPYVSFGALWCDFDSDGWQDALVTNGHVDDLVEQTSPNLHYEEPNLLFANHRDGSFLDVTQKAGAGIARPLVGRGAACGDFDGDGRPDILLVPNTGSPRLLRNTSTGGAHWLALKLIGTKSNRDGYGARVVVHAGGVTHTEWVRGGGSYLSQSDLTANVGLGTAKSIESVEIYWPSGQVDRWRSLAADKRYRAIEATGPEALPYPGAPSARREFRYRLTQIPDPAIIP